jgi:KDO2-lipid IV(A) lauroyltransferase
LLDLIASYLVRGLNRIFHVLPIGFSLWLGRRLGTVVYCFSGKRNRIAYSNLKAAFAGEKSPAELKRITKNVYRNMAQTFAEILCLTKVDRQYIDKYVNVINFERVQNASKNPDGMILLSAHFGNWELSTMASIMLGFRLHLLARDQKMQKLNELLNLLRESKGNVVIRKGADIKNIFRVLHNGEGVGILGDQNAGVHGKLIDFFGRPASTAVGPFRFAQKSGAWILPAFIHRKKGPYHDEVLEPLMKIGKKDDITPYMEEYNRLLEKHVREYPDQWLWMHKRWKVTPLKKVLVLDDGKKGHLKQSMAVVKQIRRYRQDEGFAPENLIVDTARVRFKNKRMKTLFNLFMPLVNTFFQMHVKLLAVVLEKESYQDVVNRYADVIVSCGSSLFGVNKILKMENHARNVTVLDPGPLNRASFDLIVLPRHDASDGDEEKDNVAVTDLAPNLIDAESMSRFTVQGAGSGKRIGLLLGGDNPCFSFGEALTKDIAKNIKVACEQLDGYAHITTSRRTPGTAERVLTEEFDGFPRLAEFISGKDDSDEHTVEKILAVSDIVIVSGESISMVSEAVSSGRPVMVFMPDKKSQVVTKYERFVEELRERGYLVIVKPGDIPAEANDLVNSPGKCKRSEDNKRIYDKLYRLF